MTSDAHFLRIARRQRGYVKTAQLRDAGLSDTAIRGRVRGELLIRVHHGVYAVGQVPTAFEDRAFGSWLAAGPAAWLSHSTCAAVYGILPEPPGPMHLTRPRGGRRQNGLVIHRAQMPPADRWHGRGVPLTSPARLMLDLAESQPEKALIRAYNEAQVLKLLTRSELEQAIPRWNGRRGVPILKRLIENDLGTMRSVLEDLFVPLLKQAGLPIPSFNAAVHGLEVDAVWRELKVVVELDGRRFHDTDPRFESDRARDAMLAAHGYIVLRFTHRRLRREPLAVVAELAAVLSWRTPLAA